jgi:hypothetical protein
MTTARWRNEHVDVAAAFMVLSQLPKSQLGPDIRLHFRLHFRRHFRLRPSQLHRVLLAD